MIKILFQEMLDKRRYDHDLLLERTNKEYKEALKDYLYTLRKITKPGEDIYDELELHVILVTNIANKFMYEKGIEDGMQLFIQFRELKGINSSEIDSLFYNESLDDAIKEYNQKEKRLDAGGNGSTLSLIKQYINNDASKFLLFIYKKAFEAGKKEGFKEALS